MNLRRQSIETFVPYRMVAERRKNRLIALKRPLFQGYIFVRFDLEAVRWRSVNSTLGVTRLVMFEEHRPAVVPDALVEGFKRRCNASGQLLLPDDLQFGDSVKIMSGPFADFAGCIEELSDGERARVLLELMGQFVRVSISRSDIERVSG